MLVLLLLPHPQQAWSNRAQQILVPAWNHMTTTMAPPPTTLASDTVAGPQRLAEWGKVRSHGNHYSAMIAHPQPLLSNQMTLSAQQPISIGIAHVSPKMADTAKNVGERTGEARCPEGVRAAAAAVVAPAAVAAPEAGREGEVEESCCKEEEPECEEVSQEQRQAMVISDLASPASVITISSDEEEEEDGGAQPHAHGEREGSAACEACESTVSMERVCSLSSPDSTLSTSSSASAQSGASPRKRSNSMSDDEQENGCDAVDGSPPSDCSAHSSSPFPESPPYIADGNRNCQPRVACVAPATEPGKPAVRTMVVPPMVVYNNNNNNNPGMADAGHTVLDPSYQSRGR
ncbi:hypothetical protein CRUP_023616, partial [Coryphaenoides rupestris]